MASLAPTNPDAVKAILKESLALHVSVDSNHYSSFIEIKVTLELDGKPFTEAVGNIDRQDLENLLGDEDY